MRCHSASAGPLPRVRSRCTQIQPVRSRRLSIDTPIVDQVYSLLYEGKAPIQAMQELLERDQKAEQI